MTTTSVPTPTFTPTGLSVPAPQAVLAGVQQDWVQAFALNGKTLNTELTTPQGQLQQSQSYMVSQFFAAMSALVANVDPMTSSGVYQDALGRIYFLTRQSATFATVQATVTGTPGQTLPAGSQAKSADGTIWATTTAVVYSLTSTASVTLQANVAGSGPAAIINGLSIYQQVAGWEGITNAAPSVPGTDVESRQAFEQRRFESVSIGGSGTAAAVRAAVGNVTGVTDVFVYNNGGDTAINYGTSTYPIPAHSIAIVVSGGDNTAVASAIHSKLDCGCGLPTAAGLGTLVSVSIVDSTNYIAPYPTYVVRFVRPLVTTVYFTINVANLSTLPINYVALIQQAVANAFTNGFASPDGTIVISRARVGGQILAAEYLAIVQSLGNIAPVSAYVATTASPSSGGSLTLGIDQQPVTTALNVTVNAVSI